MNIPVVDFSSFSLGAQRVSEEHLRDLGAERVSEEHLRDLGAERVSEEHLGDLGAQRVSEEHLGDLGAQRVSEEHLGDLGAQRVSEEHLGDLGAERVSEEHLGDLGAQRVSEEHLRDLGRQLKSAFTEWGFVYLKNTGITQPEVEHVMDISKTFFLQPDEMKIPFSRKTFANNPNHGWVSSETERLNPRRPGDLKEAFNVASLHKDLKWPTPAFRDVQAAFFQRCQELSLRVLRVMAYSLGLEPQVFLHAHRYIGSDENATTLRSLYYPPVDSGLVKEGQLRCGEHSDYGSFTLVFQSHEGGLQVLSRSGDYISAPSIPGTVLINIADLMQRWTSDHFISAVHRVLLPPAGDSSTRQSLAFFVHADNEALVTCCDGSNKYPAIKAGTYLTERFNDSYGKE